MKSKIIATLSLCACLWANEGENNRSVSLISISNEEIMNEKAPEEDIFVFNGDIEDADSADNDYSNADNDNESKESVSPYKKSASEFESIKAEKIKEMDDDISNSSGEDKEKLIELKNCVSKSKSLSSIKMCSKTQKQKELKELNTIKKNQNKKIREEKIANITKKRLAESKARSDKENLRNQEKLKKMEEADKKRIKDQEIKKKNEERNRLLKQNQKKYTDKLIKEKRSFGSNQENKRYQ